MRWTDATRRILEALVQGWSPPCRRGSTGPGRERAGTCARGPAGRRSAPTTLGLAAIDRADTAAVVLRASETGWPSAASRSSWSTSSSTGALASGTRASRSPPMQPRGAAHLPPEGDPALAAVRAAAAGYPDRGPRSRRAGRCLERGGPRPRPRRGRPRHPPRHRADVGQPGRPAGLGRSGQRRASVHHRRPRRAGRSGDAVRAPRGADRSDQTLGQPARWRRVTSWRRCSRDDGPRRDSRLPVPVGPRPLRTDASGFRGSCWPLGWRSLSTSSRRAANPTVVPIPRLLLQVVAQGSLVLALAFALLANRRLVVRPNLFMCCSPRWR